MAKKNNDCKQAFNIKEMIEAGVSPEDLIKRLQNEINAATAEIAAEKASKKALNDKIAEVRNALVQNCVEYLTLLGIIEDSSSVDIKGITHFLAEMEQETEELKSVLSEIELLETDDKEDLVIKAFLKNL